MGEQLQGVGFRVWRLATLLAFVFPYLIFVRHTCEANGRHIAASRPCTDPQKDTTKLLGPFNVAPLDVSFLIGSQKVLSWRVFIEPQWWTMPLAIAVA